MAKLHIVGLIGLAEPAIAFAKQLMKRQVTVVAYDTIHINRQWAMTSGIVATSSLQAVILHLPSPKVLICYMATKKASKVQFAILPDLLSEGDIVIDNGKMDARHRALLQEKGIILLNIGAKAIKAGQIWTNDAEKNAYEYCKAIFEAE